MLYTKTSSIEIDLNLTMNITPRLPLPYHVRTADDLFRFLIRSPTPHEFIRAQLQIAVALQEGTQEQMTSAVDEAEKAGLPPQGWAWQAALLGRISLMELLQKKYDIDWATQCVFIHSKDLDYEKGKSRQGVKNKVSEWKPMEPITHWVCVANEVEAAEALLQLGVSPLQPVQSSPEVDVDWGTGRTQGFIKDCERVVGESTKSWLCEALEYCSYDIADIFWEKSKTHSWSQEELDRLLLATVIPHFYRHQARDEYKSKTHPSLVWFDRLIKLGANPTRVWTLEQADGKPFEVNSKWSQAIESKNSNWMIKHQVKEDSGDVKMAIEQLQTTPIHLALMSFGHTALPHLPEKSLLEVSPDSLGRGILALCIQRGIRLSSEVMAGLASKETIWNPVSLMFIRDTNDLHQYSSSAFMRERVWNALVKEIDDLEKSGCPAHFSWPLACYLLQNHLPLLPEELASYTNSQHERKEKEQYHRDISDLVWSHLPVEQASFLHNVVDKALSIKKEKVVLDVELQKLSRVGKSVWNDPRLKALQDQSNLLWKTLPTHFNAEFDIKTGHKIRL